MGNNRSSAAPSKPWLKWCITASAFGLLALRIGMPKATVDGTTVALLFLAATPWLREFLTSAELPGGWKFHFREVEGRQKRQEAEINSLRFLVTHFLTDHEVTHLTKLVEGSEFTFKCSSSFDEELRRLRALHLIEGRPGKGIRSLNRDQRGDVNSHFRATTTGRDYLAMRAKTETEE